jgi:A/G-specific adenine glycosylase
MINARCLARKLTRWFDQQGRDLPWRRRRDPYAVWISEIMLQQTQVKTVIPYYRRWMRALPRVADLARARPQRVLKLWEGLGYYRRARHAQAAARIIVKQHGGRFPENLQDLLALPGVGRYTAGALCSIAFNQPAPILDGNVRRLLSRLLGVAGDARAVNAALWRAAQELVSTGGGQPAKLNQGLMELGALICLPRQPKCPDCPLRRDCWARRENRIADFPAPARREPLTHRRFIALVARRGGRFLVRRRPAGGVNAGLWEFPNFEAPAKAGNLSRLAAPFRIARGGPFFRLRHSITRYRMLLEGFQARLPGGAVSGLALGEWKTPAELQRLALTSAHRKLLQAASRGA